MINRFFRVVGILIFAVQALPGFSQQPSAGAPVKIRNAGNLSAVSGTVATTYSWPSAEGPRDVVVFQPTQRPSNAPIVVIAHALTMTPVNMANLVSASQIARDSGATVILPSAINNQWNVDPQNVSGSDDVAFLADVLTRSVELFGGDSTRRFMAGYSNGGFMTTVMACKRPDLLAGIASVGATIHQQVAADCSAQGKVPAAFFHGTSDLVVAYNGAGSNYGALSSFDFFRAQNGCSGVLPAVQLPNKELLNPTQVAKIVASGCGGNRDVHLFKISSGGHTWPDSTYPLVTAIYGKTTKDINATEELQNFFNAQPSK